MHYPEVQKYFGYGWLGLLLQTALFQGCQTTEIHYGPIYTLRSNNWSPWGTRLLVMATLAYPLDFVHLCHIRT